MALSPAAKVTYAIARAVQLGVDPAAALAVAKQEGGWQGAVGDNGTSFGPWQLHAGGALPSSVWAQGPTAANAWANSRAGIDYALQQIANVSRGSTGPQAVSKIVYQFERPADPVNETLKANGAYPGVKAAIAGKNYGAITGGSTPQPAPGLAPPPSIPGIGTIPGIVGGVESVGSFLGKLTDPNFWLRVLQIIGGAALAGGGLFLLARQVALANDLPDPLGVGAAAARVAA